MPSYPRPRRAQIVEPIGWRFTLKRRAWPVRLFWWALHQLGEVSSTRRAIATTPRLVSIRPIYGHAKYGATTVYR